MMDFLSAWEHALNLTVSGIIRDKLKAQDDKDALATRCDGCSYLGIDGGPGPVMVCNHPKSGTYGYIVRWDRQSKNRVSDECPKLVDTINTD